MNFSDQRIVDGATFLGVALTLFALRNSVGFNPYGLWVFSIATFFFLGLSLARFWAKK